MFVSVARVTLDIPESGSLKAKRQVVRRVCDRVKARFNVSISEVGELDMWQRAQLAMAVVGGDKQHVNEQMDKILQFIDDMYVAPISRREMEIISFGDMLYLGGQSTESGLPFQKGERSLAEAEGLGDWDSRHERDDDEGAVGPRARRPAAKVTLEQARERARALRNRREWERDE